jgi:hypothetical protein
VVASSTVVMCVLFFFLPVSEVMRVALCCPVSNERMSRIVVSDFSPPLDVVSCVTVLHSCWLTLKIVNAVLSSCSRGLCSLGVYNCYHYHLHSTCTNYVNVL